MNFLIGFNKNNENVLGTDYKRISSKKTYSGWCNEAKQMKKNQPNIEKVFVISEGQYTQEVCEMSPKEFTVYVQNIGARVL